MLPRAFVAWSRQAVNQARLHPTVKRLLSDAKPKSGTAPGGSNNSISSSSSSGSTGGSASSIPGSSSTTAGRGAAAPGAASASASGASTSAPSSSVGPKSMLESGGSFGSMSPAGQALGHAAEAQMLRLQQEAAAAAAAAADGGATAGPSLGRRALSRLVDVALLSTAGVAGYSGYLYYQYDTNQLERMVEETRSKEENAFAASKLWLAFMERYLELRKPLERKVREYTDPSSDVLLPPLPPEHQGRVKTLVLDLEDVLVHRDWTRAKGWQIFKRPGVQDFLYQMGQYYEIVVYTDESNVYVDPIINRLDNFRMIPYRLYRQDTQYHNGKHVRDLSKLNRDLSQVLFLSANPDAYQFQPENALKLRPWKGESGDTTLLDLIPFLQMVATKGVGDVRDVVKSYDGEDDVAAAFKARMHQLADAHKSQGKPRRFGLGG